MADYSKQAIIDVIFDPQLSKKTVASITGDAYFKKGTLNVVSASGDYITLKDNPELFSWRVKFNATNLTTKVFATIGTARDLTFTAGSLTGTLTEFDVYVNGVLNGSITLGENEVIGIATGSFTYTAIKLGEGIVGSMSLFQVFKSVISVEETLNKYEAKEFKEHLNTDNRILSVDGRDGIIGNKYEGDTIGSLVPAVVNTSVVSVRDGSVYANYYNGSTSKLDCGNYDDLTGDKSFIAWIKPYGLGEGGFGRIFNNSKLLMWIEAAGSFAILKARSDGSTVVQSASGVISASHIWWLIILTRTASGVSNFYVNGILSGTADQAGGTPVAGTTNILIGNSNGNDRTFYGLINQNRIEDSILTAQTVMQIYTSEKGQYGL
jgi:hypothetical protein